MAEPSRFALYLDIGALRDRHYTGIPRVVFEIARHWREAPGVACNLMIDNAVVPPHIADQIIAEGQALDWPKRFDDLPERLSVHEALAGEAGPSIGLFPMHRKTTDAPFTRVVQIIHDLTAVLVPDTHSEQLLREEAIHLDREVATSDHIVTVSESTKQHLVTYLGVPADRITTIQLGVDPPRSLLDDVIATRSGLRLEPFALVLGTVEARKNLGLVLRHLAARRERMRDHRWLFTGRIRPDVFDALRPDLQPLERELRSGRVTFLGFIPEASKHLLLGKADFAVYPSLFEGFGLPVAEALWHGCPVACSLSTSLPEVARQAGYYFDPFSARDIDRALSELIRGLRQDREAQRRRAREVGAVYEWRRFHADLGAVFARLLGGALDVPLRHAATAAGDGVPGPNRLRLEAEAWTLDGVRATESSDGSGRLTLTETVREGLHTIAQAVAGPGLATWSAALDIRPLLRTGVVVQLDDGAENAAQARFDLVQGIVAHGSARATGQARIGAAFLEALSGGWWRCALIGCPNVPVDRVRLLVYLVEDGPRVSYRGREQLAAVLARPQLEAAPYPTTFAAPRAEPSEAPAGRRSTSDVEGACLGIVAGGLVRGWARRPSRPLERLKVELHDGGRRIAEARAVEFRRELVALGKGDGCHGFSLPLPARLPSGRLLRVVIAGEDEDALAGHLVETGAVASDDPDGAEVRAEVRDIRFDDATMRWIISGSVDRLPGEESGPLLELRQGGRVLAVLAPTLPDADRPQGAGFIFSVAASELPPETVTLDIVEAGTGVAIQHPPLRVMNATARRRATIEQVLEARLPTVEAVLEGLPAAADADLMLDTAYTRCLGRPPDPTGLAIYGPGLRSGQLSPRDLVAALLGSEEATRHFAPRPILPPWL